MNQNSYVLKERLKTLIGGNKVKAALFYTFNFDPKFFENYLMPLLVPDQIFVNNSIVNNIVWRKLYKEKGRVPPVTIYCDQDAKSLENGPMLDYEIVCISLPNVGKNKGNFHPKNSFILIENESKEEQLIVLTGSNNITQSGWCENIECISETVLINKRLFPLEFTKNLNDFIVNISDNYARNLTEAETLVLGFLSKRGFTNEREMYFYDSYQKTFKEFLEEHIFDGDEIHRSEILSPYFKNDTALLEFFLEKKINVRIQMPTQGEFCILSKELYTKYKNEGARWYYQMDPGRRSHSKVYRFYSDGRTYTIIGSVNFTKPAWSGVISGKKDIYNIESAILYVDKNEQPSYLLKKEIKDEVLKFIDPENTLENWFERYPTPDISFTINWIQRTIFWKTKIEANCKLYLNENLSFDLGFVSEIQLKSLPHPQQIIDNLARHTILKVVETVDNKERTHYYYPNQIGFEQKPIEFRFSASDIIEAWELLGNEEIEKNEWFINRFEQIIDLAEDENGKIINEVSSNKSLLNEMARHFYGLAKLEYHLFDEHTSSQLRKKQFEDLRYYLTHDNIDTLVSYFKFLRKLFNDEQILPGYYWLLLQIIKLKFYANTKLNKVLREFSDYYDDNRTIRDIVNETLDVLNTEIEKIEQIHSINNKFLKWAEEILNEYELH